MKSTKKKQKQWNEHIYYIIIFIYIDFQAGKKKKKITLLRLGFEPRTLGLQGKFLPLT